MRITFNISAFGPGAAQAVEIKSKFEAILAEYGLSGEVKGLNFEQFASLYGSFSNEAKKAEKDAQQE